jgi:translation elongation factor EF-G
VGARGGGGAPPRILVNKLDRERASFERTLESLVSSFGTQVAPLEFPLGEEHAFEGVADLLSMKAYRYGSGARAEEGEWPDDIHSKADPFREKLMEAVAESDDSLIEKYLEEGELSENEIVHGVKAGYAEARIAPVLLGAAARPVGVDRLLQFISDEFPAPTERPPIPVTTKAGRRRSGRAIRTDPSPPRVQDGVRPLRRPHLDVPGLLRTGETGRVGLQRHEIDGGARRPALHAPREGARFRLRGARR